ncbi:PadR family transcriptional regulator [Streptococcus ruminantium]|uniref:PadR family transcriptional regulator n=1 Tax=Streptococcus ruminantium TaxID=1917441 RepID=A0ABU1B5B6_9STRE|nr:PadR family transcriptional regulator [Streptococcus ruminantium]MDQ8760131.1 PadR family transcriptional regulator [Streptococcus ruminantium]MDQ8769453.1 PadR family transcriptional regulator [Streptococcus ruminantium]MDQ8775409.1 PadR family transcriptional regulator [Streptococcus ruminantium]MDQ8794825.1 PadR family transcriptional regulator [Streptococcus ruminantium]MDQ8796734.1 PadR family transcriptional regulator [Streptococcus ruminantium]
MKETQMLKGILDGCVLQIIARQEIYGYELVQELRASGFQNMVGGTVYPLLQKLEKNSLIVSQNKPSPDGPDRKYFYLTTQGQAYLEDFWLKWNDLVKKVDRLATNR